MDTYSYKFSQLQKSNLDVLLIPLTGNKLTAQQAAALKELKTETIRHSQVEELKTNNSSVFFFPDKKQHPQAPRKIVLLNLPKNFEKNLSQNLQNFFSQHKNLKLGVLLPGQNNVKIATALIFAHSLSQSYKEISADKNSAKELFFFSKDIIKNPLGRAAIFTKAINQARQLSNTPANLLTPKLFANRCRELALEYGISIKILGEVEMKNLGMGGIIGVSQGSAEEAQLVVVDYNPGKKKTIALAGKGITFDSGGISLKLVKTIYEMKHDMAGGAAVLAAVLGAAALKVPYRVVGAIAASENLPSGSALKPGDVITTYSGRTVEVLNTDAEGRLVLCDALTYLQKHYQPNLIIDVATLTSAMIISLGNDINGAFGNSLKINQQLLKAAALAGENFHFMPLHSAYKNELNSEVADLRNIGKQRSDAIFAALFLENFIENNTPWLHLDIAGTAWDNKGATGSSIATLLELLSTIKL